MKLICITNWLTLWSWALPERPLDVWSLDSFPAFHGTRRFNTEFTTALHLFLSWATSIQSTSPHPTSPRSILILSTHLRLGLPNGLLPYTRSSSPPFVLSRIDVDQRIILNIYCVSTWSLFWLITEIEGLGNESLGFIEGGMSWPAKRLSAFEGHCSLGVVNETINFYQDCSRHVS
jgi:hypothetical protein